MATAPTTTPAVDADAHVACKKQISSFAREVEHWKFAVRAIFDKTKVRFFNI